MRTGPSWRRQTESSISPERNHPYRKVVDARTRAGWLILRISSNPDAVCPSQVQPLYAAAHPRCRNRAGLADEPDTSASFPVRPSPLGKCFLRSSEEPNPWVNVDYSRAHGYRQITTTNACVQMRESRMRFGSSGNTGLLYTFRCYTKKV